MAQKDKVDSDVRIVGFRGDYYDLSEKGKSKVKNLIYPVPNPEFPFLGVHFTRMVDGTIECGPNAVFTFKREGYGKTDFNFRDTLEALLYKGTWKLFFKHWRFGLKEYKRAFSKRLFLKELNRLIPSVKMDDIVEGRSGVRAMALGADGDVFDDFKIYIYLLIAALLIIGFWIYWFVIRKRKTEEEEASYRALPPYEEAMYKLNALDEKLLWQNNKTKQYYSELTEIIRGYLEREINVPALEKTSDEIIETLTDFHSTETIRTSLESIKKLKALFQEADLVKFAKSKPLALEIEEDRRDAEAIINDLKPKIISKDDELE